MKTFHGLSDFLGSTVSQRGLILTIGIFDGVHKAHQLILRTLVKRARNKGLASAVMTFDPHPVKVLHPERKIPMLISLEHRLRIFREMGLDYAIILKFDKKTAKMRASRFINMMIGKIAVREIIVGENFYFGKDKKGSLADLKTYADIYGFAVCFIKTISSSGSPISSTRIRSLIINGKFKKAARLLERPVTILGTVVMGARKGRVIGFPTANIDPHHEAIPPSGVYAVRVRLQNVMHDGILNIGVRPTFHGPDTLQVEPTIEVHIFDFKKRIYGKHLEIEFVKKIRNERKFKHALSLKAQISKDREKARGILNQKKGRGNRCVPPAHSPITGRRFTGFTK